MEHREPVKTNQSNTEMVRHFETRDAAMGCMRFTNRARTLAGNKNITAVVPGPDDGWSVVELRTAIELGLGYTWAVR